VTNFFCQRPAYVSLIGVQRVDISLFKQCYTFDIFQTYTIMEFVFNLTALTAVIVLAVIE